LHDVIFKNRGAAKRAKDADGEYGDGDGSGDGKPGAKADIDGDGAEEQPEERPKNHRAKGDSLILSSADMYVRNSPGGAVELHGRSLTETSSRSLDSWT